MQPHGIFYLCEEQKNAALFIVKQLKQLICRRMLLQIEIQQFIHDINQSRIVHYPFLLHPQAHDLQLLMQLARQTYTCPFQFCFTSHRTGMPGSDFLSAGPFVLKRFHPCLMLYFSILTDINIRFRFTQYRPEIIQLAHIAHYVCIISKLHIYIKT